MRSEKKKVKWNSDVEEFTTQAAWRGAQRDMAVVRAKLGCKHDVSEFYSPPRLRARPRLRRPGAEETFTLYSVLPLPGGRWKAGGILCTNIRSLRPRG